MATAWQEHDQDVYERLGVAGRAEVEASHGNAPAARLFLVFTIQHARARVYRSVDPVCSHCDNFRLIFSRLESFIHRAYIDVLCAVGASC